MSETHESPVVVSDTSCLIVLNKINALHLLPALYQQIWTTPEVAAEYGKDLPDWVILQSVTNQHYLQMLCLQVDEGEASAIALALELPADLLILDDDQARKLARRLGISITGTLGLLLKAKSAGLIPQIKPYIQMIQLTDFRVSQVLVDKVLRMADEA